MRTNLLRIALSLAVTCSALAPATHTQASLEEPVSASVGVSPAGLLNPDGTLNLNGNFSGALDLSGWSVTMDAERGPVFGPASEVTASASLGDWAALGEGGGVVDDRVRAIVVNGPNVYIGGDFTDLANLSAADYVARWDGANWSALGNNSSGDGALTGYIYALAITGTSLYVGGYFASVYNGGALVNGAAYIARWDTLAGSWSALGSNGAGNSSIVGTVYSLAVSGSNVYVGGQFTDVNNNGTVLGAADYIARWDGTNWSALGNNGAGDGSFGSGTYIAALAASGSNVYVGGAFTNVNNSGVVLTAADYVARWDGTNWSALSSNGAGNGSITGGVVNSLAVSGSNVYVGGQFTNVNNNGTVLGAADFIARWDGANWSALGSNGAGDGSLIGTVLALFTNGTDVYVGGFFTNVNNNGTVVTAADYVARWDGANWSALGNDGAGNGAITGKGGPFIFALALQGANLLAGGNFYDLSNGGTILPQADYLARWDGANWSALGTANNGALTNGYASSRVQAIAIIGADVYVGGYFVNISNHGLNLPEGDFIARWNAQSGDWSALGGNGAGNGSLTNEVAALAVSGTDLYVGGRFTNVNNNGTALPTADYVAKWNTLTNSWSALGSNGAGNGSLPSGSFVNTLTVSGTVLYVGGNFTNVNNNGVIIPEADYLATWSGTNWSPVGNNGAGDGALNGQVAALAWGNSGELYVGGNFTNAAALPEADYIARWSGIQWSALGNNSAGDGALNAGVSAIAVTGTTLYAGGSFTNVNNGGTLLNAADYIARWDGANWSALGSNGTGNGSLNSAVRALAVNGSDVYVGGFFTNVNNSGTLLAAADHIARWDPQAGSWSALGNNGAGNGSISGYNDYVYTLAVNGSDLLVGGQFANVNNNGVVLPEADYVAAYSIVLHQVFLPLISK